MTLPSDQLRQTGRYERKREAILDAAASLFNRKGLKGATLSDVAQNVGLITTSVTYYYKKKEDLAAACFLRSIEALEELLAQIQPFQTPDLRLHRLLRLYFQRMADIAEGKRPELIGFYDIRALTGRHMDTVFSRYVGLFRRIRDLFWPDGETPLNRMERNARTHLIFSLLLGSREWVGRYETDDYPRAAERMADLLLNGFAGPGLGWTPLSLPIDAAMPGDPSETGREAFLRAATELVNEQGYHGASVEKISARLQVTKGSFYHHNDTKDDLVIDCFERSFAAVRRIQRIAAETGTDGWSRACAAADALVRLQFSSHGPLLRHTALTAVPEVIRPRLTETVNRLSERFANWIVDGIADGSVRPVDPAIAARLIYGMINTAANLERWVPEATAETAPNLFARPLFLGLLNTGP